MLPPLHQARTLWCAACRPKMATCHVLNGSFLTHAPEQAISESTACIFPGHNPVEIRTFWELAWVAGLHRHQIVCVECRWPTR